MSSRGFESEGFKIKSGQNQSIDLLPKIELRIEPALMKGFHGELEAGFTPYLAGEGLFITEFKRNLTESVQLDLSLSRPDRPDEPQTPVVACSGFS